MVNAISQYQQVGVETGMADASPHGLILMLLEGAMISINMAKVNMASNKVSEKGAAISRAIAIIDEGLRLSLDKKAGGEIADNLDALYEYMGHQLLTANMRNSQDLLDEVTLLLSGIKGAWQEIAPNKSSNQTVVQPAGEPTTEKREPLSYGKF